MTSHIFKEENKYRNYKKPKLVLYLQVRLERENKKLLADNLRLDTENDNLARELLTSKIEMRKDFDEIEDTKDFFEKELEATKSQLAEVSFFFQFLVEKNIFSNFSCSIPIFFPI